MNSLLQAGKVGTRRHCPSTRFIIIAYLMAGNLVPLSAAPYSPMYCGQATAAFRPDDMNSFLARQGVADNNWNEWVGSYGDSEKSALLYSVSTVGAEFANFNIYDGLSGSQSLRQAWNYMVGDRDGALAAGALMTYAQERRASFTKVDWTNDNWAVAGIKAGYDSLGVVTIEIMKGVEFVNVLMTATGGIKGLAAGNSDARFLLFRSGECLWNILHLEKPIEK